MIEIDIILLVGAVVLIAAIIAARIGTRIGLPSLLLFLGLGMVMGESVIGISFDNADLAQALGFAALVVILAEGGLTTRWSDIRSSTILASLLATVGIGISVGLMTLFGHYVLGLPIWIAMLLGAVTSPTDASGSPGAAVVRVPSSRGRHQRPGSWFRWCAPEGAPAPARIPRRRPPAGTGAGGR